MFLDVVARMSDVELLAELRRIVNLSSTNQDQTTTEQARSLFITFYDYRIRGWVPDWLWDSTRTFVRQHAP